MAEAVNYQLVFVDDESIVRDGISACIEWGDNGFTLAGLFENGEQALEHIERHPTDIVITDINMPKMDGLTFSRILSERYPGIPVLLLTGYDEFEYAQEAVKNHVREFLLKPITALQLTDVLKKIKFEMDTLREKEKQHELMQRKLLESFPLLKERFLYRLVSGRLIGEIIGRKKKYFDWIDRGKFYQVIVLLMPPNWDELNIVAITEFLREETEREDEVFSNKDENLVLLLQDESRELLSQKTQTIIRKAFRFSMMRRNEKISGGYGEIVDSRELLYRSYKEACTALDYSQVLGLTKIVSIENVRERKSISPDMFNALVKNLTEQLKGGGRNQTRAVMEEIFGYLEKHYITSSEIAHYLMRLHFHIYYFLDEMDLFAANADFFPRNPQAFSTLDQARSFFIRMIEQIEDRIQTRRNDIVLSRVDKAREIISQRFRDFDFSLNDICNELYLSVSQFSLLFKEGTGRTFVEYLTHYRMEEAKKLLKTTDKKVYEIAEVVGFRDPRYFCLTFKKLTGMTALEFKDCMDK